MVRSAVPARSLTIAVFTVLSASVSTAQVTLPDTARDLSHESAEYPPYEETTWRMQRPGRLAKSAAAALAQAPAAAETPALLVEANRHADALRSLERLVRLNPDRIARGFELLNLHHHKFYEPVHPEWRERLRAIVAAAGKQAAALPRNEAARAAYHLLFPEFSFASNTSRASKERQLRTFINRYAGTEEALIAEVDVISQEIDLLRKIARYKAFAAAHPGTSAAAKALHQAGFELGVNVGTSGRIPRGSDPTDRILEVYDLVKELRSGRYPECEWVANGPSLVLHAFASKPSYSPANIDRLLLMYRALLRQHLARGNQIEIDFAVGILMKAAALLEIKGTPGQLDNVLAELEQNGARRSMVRYVEGMFHIASTRDGLEDGRPDHLARAKAALLAVQSGTNPTFRRRALAVLASLYYADGDFRSAEDAYRRYVRTYTQSPYAPLAAIRLGQSLERLGDASGAVAAYRQAAASYGRLPVFRTFARVYVARALDSSSRFDETLPEIERALRGWDADFGEWYSIAMGYPGLPNDREEDTLRREQLDRRAQQLRQSVPAAGGRLLERGRWLLDHGNPTDALRPLEEARRAARDAYVVNEARFLIHHARLRRALGWVTGGKSDTVAALADLDLVARDEYDVGVLAAKVAKASILWKQIASPDADTLMQEALGEWSARQLHRATLSPPSELARDASAIWSLIFQPDDAVYGAWVKGIRTRYKATAPFAIARPEVRVKRSDGSSDMVQVAGESLAAVKNVLFFSPQQLELLKEIHATLDGSRPSADSRVFALWSRFIRADIGMGLTLILESPIVSEIEFLDAARTRAAARVHLTSYSCTVIFEKDARGLWRAVRITNSGVA